MPQSDDRVLFVQGTTLLRSVAYDRSLSFLGLLSQGTRAGSLLTAFPHRLNQGNQMPVLEASPFHHGES